MQMKVNEKTIQALLMRQCMAAFKHECAVPNTTSFFHWEADLISVTKAGFVHEYEIKISLSDYKADAKKENKHWHLQHGYRRPNYFWYVTHNFDIEPPVYAGWIKITEAEIFNSFCVRLMKPAPHLHKIKIAEKQRLQIIRSLSWRLLSEYEKKHLNLEHTSIK